MDKVWLKNYPEGMPHTIDPTRFASLVDMFNLNCHQFANRSAFENFGTRLTFAETHALSKQFATYLQQDLKLEKGARVAVILPNLLQYPITVFGTLLAGGTIVNVNPLYTASEMLHQLKDAAVDVVVVLENFAYVLEEVLKQLPVKQVILTEIGDLCRFPKSYLINWYVKYIKRMVPESHVEKTIRFKDALKKGKNLSFEPVDINSDDLAFLQYTGGTTGVAKGAMLTHGNMVANVLQVKTWIEPRLDIGKEIIVTALPLYHIFCLEANLLTFMSLGTTNLLITNPRDLDQFIKTIAKSKFTIMTGVNTLFNALVNHPNFKKIDFSHFKIALGGGMAVQRAVSERWEAITGRPLIEGYGLTETSPVVAIHPHHIEHYIDAVGLPLPSTEVKIVNSAGQTLGVNAVGELLVRGPQVMKGYWRRGEETREVIDSAGWLRTGDMAEMDELGFLKIVDRKKDMIIVSGFNVYPNEIEEVIAEIPAVLEVAVIGVPDENSGELVKAFITRQDDLTAEQVIAHCREKLTRYKVPKQIEFREQLPKTNVGKIMRKALREV